MIRDTGSPRADAESDFLRARRHQVMRRIAARFRSNGEETISPMSFDEAVEALGRRNERSLGTLVIPLDRIVGSVDKVRDFDRGFRPTSARSRARWERLAQAMRRGEDVPPIDVYKLGDLYFVQDGHHRVSVARALDLGLIEANVHEIVTAVDPADVSTREDLDRKWWRRIFVERVPLASSRIEQITLSRPPAYGQLAEMVEAWGARLMHREATYLDKPTMAERWWTEEFEPVSELLSEAELRATGETPADAYLRVAGERYTVIRDHIWDHEVIELLQQSKQRRRAKSTPKAKSLS